MKEAYLSRSMSKASFRKVIFALIFAGGSLGLVAREARVSLTVVGAASVIRMQNSRMVLLSTAVAP
jgi:nitrate/nitrite-specific signal transduction histidine kinase